MLLVGTFPKAAALFRTMMASSGEYTIEGSNALGIRRAYGIVTWRRSDGCLHNVVEQIYSDIDWVPILRRAGCSPDTRGSPAGLSVRASGLL